MGEHPVVVSVDPESHDVHVYLRQVGDQVLTFVRQGDAVQDEEMGSTWQMDRGLAVERPLRGEALRTVPYVPAFPNAWRDWWSSSWVLLDQSYCKARRVRGEMKGKLCVLGVLCG